MFVLVHILVLAFSASVYGVDLVLVGDSLIRFTAHCTLLGQNEIRLLFSLSMLPLLGAWPYF